MSAPPQHDFGKIPDPLDSEPVRPVERPLRVLPAASDRAALRRQRLGALAFSLAWIAGHLLAYGVRPDLAELPAAYALLQITAPVVLAVVALIVAVAPGKLGLGVRVSVLGALAVLGPLSFWLAAGGAPPPKAVVDATPLLNAFICLDITIAWAAVPLACAALVMRRAFPAAAGYRGALLGVACGLLAGGAINLHCANVARLHMLLGHGLPVLIATLVGAALVSRVARS